MSENKFQPVEAEESTGKVWWSAFVSQVPGILVFVVIVAAFFAYSLGGGEDLFHGIGMLLVGPVVYLAPSAVAWNRKHNNRAAIITLNILLGWTLIGWVGALVWAMTKDVEGK